MIKNIATVAVYVDDQQSALRFWTEQVGFEQKKRMPMGPSGDWLEVGPSDAESCLVIYPKSMMEDWAERKPSIVFECAAIQSACDRDVFPRGCVYARTKSDAVGNVRHIRGLEWQLVWPAGSMSQRLSNGDMELRPLLIVLMLEVGVRSMSSRALTDSALLACMRSWRPGREIGQEQTEFCSR